MSTVPKSRRRSRAGSSFVRCGFRCRSPLSGSRLLFAAIFGSDLVTNNAGTNVSSVPSAVVVALFAVLATWAVAKYGLGRRGDDAD